MSTFKAELEHYISHLPLGKSISFTEAEKRAGMFLEAMAKVTEWRHQFSDVKIGLLSTQTAVYAEQMQRNASVGTVTAAKIAAEASEDYTKAREELEGIENDLSYLKAMFDIFNNAHVFFRQVAKSENA